MRATGTTMAFENEGGYYTSSSRWQGRGMIVFRLLCALFIPWYVFFYVYDATAMDMHRYFPWWCWFYAVLAWGWVFVYWFLYTAARAAGRIFDAKWQFFLALQMMVTVCAATFLGNRIYFEYNEVIYNFKALEPYTNVNPAKDIGDEFLDAGQLYFKEGSHVDVARGIAFKNFDVYCVAPIIRKTLENEEEQAEGQNTVELPASGTVDFFAVGKNCCEPNGEKFACGDYGGDARSGLRVLEAADRPYYAMAAEAWTAKYKLPAKHPVFVSWVIDPLGVVGGIETASGKLYAKTIKWFNRINVVVILAFMVLFRGWDYSGRGKF